jgi:hypothetical protein
VDGDPAGEGGLAQVFLLRAKDGNPDVTWSLRGWIATKAETVRHDSEAGQQTARLRSMYFRYCNLLDFEAIL